jgi:hypothetical protein
MDVQIGEVNASVKMTESQSMLSPRLLELIVQAVTQRIRQQTGHDERAGQERTLKTSVTRRE